MDVYNRYMYSNAPRRQSLRVCVIVCKRVFGFLVRVQIVQQEEAHEMKQAPFAEGRG